MIAEKVIKKIRNNKFKGLSETFLRVNRIAYINARLWQEYSLKTDPVFKELSKDALKETILHLDKSIHTLAAIKRDSDSVFGEVKTAELKGSEIQSKISEALLYYVKVEKNWLKLNDLVDSIERVGVANQEDIIRSDIKRLFDDISINLKKAIDILVNVRKKAIDEWMK